MKREIKFRVWDKKYKRFIYNDPHISLDLRGNVYNLQNGEGGEAYELSQSTGLKDKKGRLCYENDIVQWYDKYDYSTPHDVVSLLVGTYGTDFLKFLLYTDFEIIGNIYENPELLSHA